MATRRRRALSPGACALAAAALVMAGASQASAVLFPWTLAPSVPTASYAEGNGASMLPDGSASVVTGWFSGAGLDFGDGVPRTAAPTLGVLFTQKINRNGSVAWTRTSSGSANSSANGLCASAMPSGQSFITGYFEGSAVDLGDGVTRSSLDGAARTPSMFIQRLRADGSVEWTGTSSAPGFQSTRGECVSALADGRSVLVGSFAGTNVDLGDGVPRTAPAGQRWRFVQMRRADGTVAWTITSPGAECSLSEWSGVSALPDGRSVVAACFKGSGIDLGDGVPRTSSRGGAGEASFAQMIRPDGSIAWTTAVPSSAQGESGAWAVSALPDGRSFITGQWSGVNMDLGDGVLRTSAEGGLSNTAFTQMLRPDGSVAWTTVSGEPGPHESNTGGSSVSARPDGSVVAAGFFQGDAVTLGDGVPRRSANNGGSTSSFTQGLRPDGSVAWTSTSSAGTPSDVIPNGVSALPDGSLVQAGAFHGVNVDLGDGVLRTSSFGGSDTGYGSYFSQQMTSVPAAPEAPAAVAGAERATVTVTPLAGGSVTSYTVTAEPGGRTCTIAPPATTCTATGLDGGRPTTFTAVATNAAGTSPASPASTAVTPAPTGLSARVLAAPSTIMSSRRTRLSIRVSSRTTTAHSVTACLAVPRNLRVIRAPGALRTPGRACFRLSTVRVGDPVTRSVTVRARSARTVRRVVRGSISAPAMRRAAAKPAVVTIRPYQPPPVTG